MDITIFSYYTFVNSYRYFCIKRTLVSCFTGSSQLCWLSCLSKLQKFKCRNYRKFISGQKAVPRNINVTKVLQKSAWQKLFTRLLLLENTLKLLKAKDHVIDLVEQLNAKFQMPFNPAIIYQSPIAAEMYKFCELKLVNQPIHHGKTNITQAPEHVGRTSTTKKQNTARKQKITQCFKY